MIYTIVIILVSLLSMLLGVGGVLWFQLRKRRALIDSVVSGTARYQLLKNIKLDMKPIPPPDGLTSIEVERFDKLAPLHQHQFVAARKKLGLDQ